MKPNKASGSDNIPCRLLKEAADEIAPVLTDILYSSFRSGFLPKDWKLGRVALVFKKGNTNEPADYRPIFLTCVCSKLLEHIICHHIREHLDNLSILSVFQHGFRSGHSCVSQLLVTSMTSWLHSTEEFIPMLRCLIFLRHSTWCHTVVCLGNSNTTASQVQPLLGYLSSSLVCGRGRCRVQLDSCYIKGAAGDCSRSPVVPLVYKWPTWQRLF